MKAIKFDCNGHNAPAYGCNKPGDNSGEYVRADVAQELYNALKWVHERARQDANGEPIPEDFDDWFDSAQTALAAADGGGGMSERKAGWYWVRNDDEWMPAYYGVMAWTWAYMSMDGCDELEIHEDEDVPFDKIGPRIPTPDETWRCVPKEPTQDMLRASLWSGSGDISINEDWARREAWKRMFLAAPSPEDV